MARPGLIDHPKFKRLCHMLAMPEPHVLGHLEYLWRPTYQAGDARLGDAMDVELAAGWVGEPGKLCDALLKCGGKGRVGFIEPVPGERRAYQVHDLFDHAPEYVEKRAVRERERSKDKKCDYCATVFHSPETHARFCSPACRQADYRKRVTHGDEPHRNGVTRVTERDGPPAPAPAPAPAPIKRESPQAGQPTPPQKRFVPPTVEEVRAYCLDRKNSIDPEAFVAHYEANGWVQSNGQPIKKWKAAVVTWEKNEGRFGARPNSKPQAADGNIDHIQEFIKRGEK